jgi:DNA sulfur modification protein DndE
MHYSKLRISADATSKLRTLKQRVSVTPNLLCRYALVMSLEEGPIGNTPIPDDEGQEFNAYTLTGDQTQLYLAAISFVEDPDGRRKLSDERIIELLRSHIHRGIGSLGVRLKSAADLFRFDEAAQA